MKKKSYGMCLIWGMLFGTLLGAIMEKIAIGIAIGNCVATIYYLTSLSSKRNNNRQE